MRGIIEDFIFHDILSIAMVILFGLPILVFLLIGYKKLFNKCNEKGWQAFVPIYNTYILGEIAGVHWYYSLLANSFFIVETLEFYDYEIVFFFALLGWCIIAWSRRYIKVHWLIDVIIWGFLGIWCFIFSYLLFLYFWDAIFRAIEQVFFSL